MSFTTQAGHTAAHLYAFKCSGSGWPEVCCGSRDRLLPPFVFRSLPVLGLAKKNMGDRQRFDHGILKEGFLGKAKLNKVSQLFSKKGKVSCIDPCFITPSLCGPTVRSHARAAVELLWQ